MSGFMIKDVSDQVIGKGIPPARGSGKRDKFIDIVANMKVRLLKVEIAVVDTPKAVDLLE